MPELGHELLPNSQTAFGETFVRNGSESTQAVGRMGKNRHKINKSLAACVASGSPGANVARGCSPEAPRLDQASAKSDGLDLARLELQNCTL